ncbi:hypothetical protein [uncultured Intestinimonas sp.]|uniref:hypothetical protein n=1 Tax=uncultured Intestinimonas sp. TaxID=1689265 RepID=UPI0029437BB1|nr:hypothetical protein [uncultured Intestinimonas sp.]
MPEMKRSIKDSVFTMLFQDPEYLRQLYLTLHPEDAGVLPEDMKLITLENVLTTGIYNDLGIQVRDRLILLVEAQSTFSANITLRMLLYLAATYKEYVKERKLDLYAGKAVSIPRPELYVVYTGRRETPDTLLLSGLYESAPEDGRVQHMELAVQILRDDGSGSVIDQYVRFCQISNEMRGKHGATLKAVQETLRECVRQNILAPFLMTREKEVSDIMISLFNQEEIQAIHDYNVAKQAQETALKQTVLLMRDLGVAREEAVRQLAKRYDLLQNDAETAVRQYWTI